MPVPDVQAVPRHVPGVPAAAEATAQVIARVVPAVRGVQLLVQVDAMAAAAADPGVLRVPGVLEPARQAAATADLPAEDVQDRVQGHAVVVPQDAPTAPDAQDAADVRVVPAVTADVPVHVTQAVPADATEGVPAAEAVPGVRGVQDAAADAAEPATQTAPEGVQAAQDVQDAAVVRFLVQDAVQHALEDVRDVPEAVIRHAQAAPPDVLMPAQAVSEVAAECAQAAAAHALQARFKSKGD